MKKGNRILIYPLLFMGLVLILVNSCKKKEEVPVLTTSTVSAITTTTATSGGNITADGGAAVTARGVCWSTEATPTIADSKTTNGTGTGGFSSPITDLTPGTTYNVCAYATNSAGTGYGSVKSFTTLALEVPVLTTSAVTAIAVTTATSGGEITSDGGSAVTARGVCWSTGATPTTADSKTTDATGAGSFTSAITGLTGETAYYVRAYATNSTGTGYGAAVSFTTLAPSVLATLTTSAVTAIGITTATGGGNITSDGGSTVTASGVCWSTAATPTIDDSKTTDGTATGSFASAITGLTGGTTYNVRAYATNSVGTAYGTVVSFTTLSQAQLAVLTTSEVSNITATTATGGGDITSDGGDAITVRGVCWSTETNPTIADSKTTDGDGTGSFTSAITGLTGGTTYYIRAYATNSVGTGYGNELVFLVSDLAIGSNYQGGKITYIFQSGDPGYVAGEIHGLIIAPSDESPTYVKWNPTNILTNANGTELGTGMTNTNTIVAIIGDGEYAAKMCYDLVIDGYDDWFLPSKDELNQVYLNNDPNDFPAVYYWTSTEESITDAWWQEFDTGAQGFTDGKLSGTGVRAMRYF